MPTLPDPRGPLTEELFAALAAAPRTVGAPAVAADAGLEDDDLQLALYACYELHYRGFEGVDERWEWEPSLIGFRAVLEERFEQCLQDALGPIPAVPAAEQMDLALRAIAAADDAPAVSRYIERDATPEQVKEFVIHRSAYQLKEADPHGFAIPRLSGPPKAALVEVLYDEWGGGDATRIHARLFADSMDALDLDSRYGAYVDRLPGVTLATVNLMSLLALHRRHRGALCGHLAIAEMTSSIPNRRYADGLRRLGLDGATAFFDEHVVADAVHENVATVDLAGGLVRAAPELGPSILWGACALNLVEGRWARHLMDRWHTGQTSLLAARAAATLR